MGLYDDFRTRMQCSLSQSEKNRNSIVQVIKDGFYSLPSVFSVYLNSATTVFYDAQILSGETSKNSLGYKTIISYPYDTIKFKIGDYVHFTYNGATSTWLLTSLDTQNIYSVKGRIFQCNGTLKVAVSSVDTITGYDSLGRPITTTVNTYYENPCFYLSKVVNATDGDLSNAVNIPFGHILVSYQYDSTKVIKSGMKFTLNGLNYLIVSVDNSHVLNSKGYSELLAKEVLS